MLGRTSFGSELTHNLLRVWMTCWGVEALAFAGLDAASSSNCRSVSTPTPNESAWASIRPGITLHVTNTDAQSRCQRNVARLLTFARRSPRLHSEQDQRRHCLGLHRPCRPGPCGHGNGFSTVDLVHYFRFMLLDTVQLRLQQLARRQKIRDPILLLNHMSLCNLDDGRVEGTSS